MLTDEDYCLVIAGAGAGKTTTVAAKVKYLVEKKNINPREILVVSFTNKAVGELQEKIKKQLKIDCPITTFHSTGNAILHKENDEKRKTICKKNGVSLNIKIIEGAEKSIPSIFLYTKNCCNVIKNIRKSLHLYLGIV